jgi:hypothetical protein
VFYFIFLITKSCIPHTVKKYFLINYFFIITGIYVVKIFRNLIMKMIVGLPKISEDKKG